MKKTGGTFPETVVVPTGILCHVCHTTVTNVRAISQHLLGKKHQKALNLVGRVEPTGNATPQEKKNEPPAKKIKLDQPAANVSSIISKDSQVKRDEAAILRHNSVKAPEDTEIASLIPRAVKILNPPTPVAVTVSDPKPQVPLAVSVQKPEIPVAAPVTKPQTSVAAPVTQPEIPVAVPVPKPVSQPQSAPRPVEAEKKPIAAKEVESKPIPKPATVVPVPEPIAAKTPQPVIPTKPVPVAKPQIVPAKPIVQPVKPIISTGKATVAENIDWRLKPISLSSTGPLNKLLDAQKNLFLEPQIENTIPLLLPNKFDSNRGDNSKWETAAKMAQTSNSFLDLEKCTEPMIGLEYLVEMQEYDSEPRYHCVLCDKMGDPRTIVIHITSSTHRMKYFDKHYPSLMKELGELRYDKEARVAVIKILEEVASAVEKYHGRSAPVVLQEHHYKAERMRYMKQIIEGKHFSEFVGPSFVQLVDKKKIANITRTVKLKADVQRTVAEVEASQRFRSESRSRSKSPRRSNRYSNESRRRRSRSPEKRPRESAEKLEKYR